MGDIGLQNINSGLNVLGFDVAVRVGRHMKERLKKL